MASEEHRREVVPYGSAYGLDHQMAQEALKHVAIVRLDHATLALAELHLTDKLIGVYAEHVRDRDAREYLIRCAQGDSAQEWAVGDLPEVYSERCRTYDF